MVESVRESGLEPQRAALSEPELLHQSQVDVLHRRSLQDVDARVAEPADVIGTVANRVVVRATWHPESGDVKPVVDALMSGI